MVEWWKFVCYQEEMFTRFRILQRHHLLKHKFWFEDLKKSISRPLYNWEPPTTFFIVCRSSRKSKLLSPFTHTSLNSVTSTISSHHITFFTNQPDALCSIHFELIVPGTAPPFVLWELQKVTGRFDTIVTRFRKTCGNDFIKTIIELFLLFSLPC